MPATQQSHLTLPISHGLLSVASGHFQNIMFVPFKDRFLYHKVMCFGEEITKHLQIVILIQKMLTVNNNNNLLFHQKNQAYWIRSAGYSGVMNLHIGLNGYCEVSAGSFVLHTV
jgi:hypothetical protein